MSLLRSPYSVVLTRALSGKFEPPGAQSISAYVATYDRETDPRWQAIKVAERRAEEAEKLAARASIGVINFCIRVEYSI